MSTTIAGYTYTPVTWKNEETALNETNLNSMSEAISKLMEAVFTGTPGAVSSLVYPKGGISTVVMAMKETLDNLTDLDTLLNNAEAAIGARVDAYMVEHGNEALLANAYMDDGIAHATYPILSGYIMKV